MKLALAVQQFFPEHHTGTEVLTHRTARRLRELGHEVTIFTAYPLDYRIHLPPDKLMDEYHFDEFPVCRFLFSPEPNSPHGHIIKREYCNQQIEAAFERQLKDRQIHLVHFFHFMRLGMSLIDVCDRLSIPAIYTATDFFAACHQSKLMLEDGSPCQGPDDIGLNCIKHYIDLAFSQKDKQKTSELSDAEWERLIAEVRSPGSTGTSAQMPGDGTELRCLIEAVTQRGDYVRRQLRKLNRITAATEPVRDTINRLKGDGREVLLLPHGIDKKGVIARERKQTTPLRAGFIGSVIAAKGVHTLVKAARQIPQEVPLQLKIYGEPVSEGYYQDLLRMADGDSRIEFCGLFPNDKIWQVIDELDVLVMPSTWPENLPLVLLSAQAAHCPLLCSKVDGISGLIKHDVNGLLFEKEDYGQLAEHLRKVIDDPELLTRLSRNAAPVASIEEYVDSLTGLYEEVTATRTGMTSIS